MSGLRAQVTWPKTDAEIKAALERTTHHRQAFPDDVRLRCDRLQELVERLLDQQAELRKEFTAELSRQRRLMLAVLQGQQSVIDTRVAIGQIVPSHAGAGRKLIRQIVQALCDVCVGVTPQQVLSESRNARVVLVRHVAMHVAASQFGFCMGTIGRHLNRDRTTVLYGLQMVQENPDHYRPLLDRAGEIFLPLAGMEGTSTEHIHAPEGVPFQ